MAFTRRTWTLALILILTVAIVAVPIGTASAATWTKIASKGLTPPDPKNTHTYPGAVFKNKLMVGGGAWGAPGGPMHTYDGSVFKKIATSGFGNGHNLDIHATVVYHGELYIGTTNFTDGCEFWKWSGTGNPVKLKDHGFGEGNANDEATPLGVINDKLIVGISNVIGAKPGVRVYSYNGSTWKKLVGPGAAVNPGFGDPNSTGFPNEDVVKLDSKLIFPVTNFTTGLKVYSYNGVTFKRIGKPGAGSWPATQFFADATVSQVEGKVYMGTGTSLAGVKVQLWSYDGSVWKSLNTNSLGDPDNTFICPLSRGDNLYAITRNGTHGCRVYKRSGSSTFNSISAAGFTGPANIEGYLSSFNGKLLAFTNNGAGSAVYATTIGPSIDRLVPDSGPYGTKVQIEGHDFGRTQGSSTVTFNNWKAEVLSWSDTSIEAVFPYQATSGPVVVSTSRGDSNAVNFTLTLSKTWYFAEGTTRNNVADGTYEEWLSVQNPGTKDANLQITYMLTDGTTKKQTAQVKKKSRNTINVNGFMGADKDVSTLIESDQLVLAERPMYFDYRSKWTGGHDVIGLPTPRTKFYFAEGTTRANPIDGYFEQWLCFQNPGSADATVSVDYVLGMAGSVVKRSYTVKAHSRRTVDVNLEIGKDQDVSAVVTSDKPIVAERPMYFNYHNKWTGGHDIIGAPGPDKAFYFAEGTTRDNAADGAFEEWICLQNADSQDANVTITYYTDQVGVQTQNVLVKGNSRETVDVKLRLGADVDTSFMIKSDRDILAERPMYFNYHNAWDGGHDVMGCAQPKKKFYFAEGTTLPGFATWLAVMNTGNKDMTVTFNYMLGNGTNKQVKATVKAHKRYTRDVVGDVGANQNVSILVEGVHEIVAERPMYFDYHAWCTGGHDTLGYGI